MCPVRRGKWQEACLSSRQPIAKKCARASRLSGRRRFRIAIAARRPRLACAAAALRYKMYKYATFSNPREPTRHNRKIRRGLDCHSVTAAGAQRRQSRDRDKTLRRVPCLPSRGHRLNRRVTGDANVFCSGFDLKAAATMSDEQSLAGLAFPEPDDGRPSRGPMGPTRLELDKPVIARSRGRRSPAAWSSRSGATCG
jgi:hypothetical protein